MRKYQKKRFNFPIGMGRVNLKGGHEPQFFKITIMLFGPKVNELWEMSLRWIIRAKPVSILNQESPRIWEYTSVILYKTNSHLQVFVGFETNTFLHI